MGTREYSQVPFFGAEGDRTPNLSIANAALSQLSYGPYCANSTPPSGVVNRFFSSSLHDMPALATAR